MTTEHFTLLLGILSTMVSGAVGIILALIRRDMGRVQVRLAEVEAKRENARADDANMAMALQLATTMATTLEPVRAAMSDLVRVANRQMDNNQEMLSLFVQKTDEMHAVTERRDKEIEALPGKFKDVVTPQLEAMTQALAALQEEVHNSIAQLPDSERSILALEMQQYTTQIFRRLDQVTDLIQLVREEQRKLHENAHPPGEAISSPEPETTEEIREEKAS